MRKILSVCLSIVMMLSCLSLGLTAFAAGDATVSTDANVIIAKEGETVTVTFKVENCEDAKALMFYNFAYDTDVLEMTGGEWLFDSSAMQDVSTSDKTAVIAFSANSAVDGDILKMNFKIADDAAAGSYEIGYDVVFKAATDAEDKVLDVTTETVVIRIEPKTDIIPEDPSDTSVYSLGDIDNSGTITAADARAILRFSAKLDDLSAEQQKAADVDGNGTVNAADARITLRISAKLEKIEDYIKDSEIATETPVTEESSIEEPSIEEPSIEEPSTEEPSTEEPSTEEPSIEEPSTEEPSTEEPSTEEPSTDNYENIDELSLYMLTHIDYVVECIPELEQYEDSTESYCLDNICFYIDNDGFVTSVDITGESKYTIYGVEYGMDYDEAISILEEYGFTVDEFGWAENEAGYNVFIASDDGETVAYICVYIIYTEKDLAWCTLSCIDYLNADYKLNDKGDGWYDLDGAVSFYAPYGLISQIVINDYCDYNIYGVEYGMDRATVLELLDEGCFVMEDDTFGTDDIGNSIELSYDEDSDTVNYISFYYSDYDVYDLIWYMYDSELIENYFDVVYDDSYSWYSNDNTYSFYIYEDVNSWNCTVDIFGECDFNIYGVTYGMDRETALSVLADAGITMEDDTIGEDMYGDIVYLEYDEASDTVNYISYCDNDEYDYQIELSSYLGFDYEFISEVFPFEEEDESYSWSGNIGFSFDEDNYVDEVCINDESFYNIYGVVYGMDVGSAVELLESAGFEVDDDFDTMIYSENMYNGTFVAVSVADGLVTAISCGFI